MDKPKMEPENHNQIMYMLGQMDSKLDSIQAQVTKTNGRVTSLEGRQVTTDNFILTFKTKIAMVSGAISLVGVVAWEVIKTKLSHFV